MFKQITQIELYHPFDDKYKVNRKNIFGVIVLLEDSNILRDKVYDKAIEMLKLHTDSIEANFLKSNIIIYR